MSVHPTLFTSFSVLVILSYLSGVLSTVPVVDNLAGGGSITGLVNGIGTNAVLRPSYDIAASSDNSFAIVPDSSNNAIRKIDLTTLAVTVLAGQASSGSGNGIGTNAQFNNPTGVSLSSDNSYVLIGDSGNNMIRKVVITTGAVTTLAGQTSSGFVDSTGTDAIFNFPSGICRSTSDSYALVADTSNNAIRSIVIATGVVTTLATGFSGPRGITLSSDNSFALVADTNYHIVRKVVIATGTVSTLAGSISSSGSANGIGASASFNSPTSVTLSSDNSYVLVSDSGNNIIRKITLATETVTTFIGGGASGTLLGHVDGVGSNSLFNSPFGLELYSSNTLLLVCDSSNQVVRLVDVSTITVSPFVGKHINYPATGTSAVLGSVISLSFSQKDSSFGIFVDYSYHKIRKVIISTRAVTSFVGGGSTGVSSGYGNGVGTAVMFSSPSDLSLSYNDKFAYVSDTGNHNIRRVNVSKSSVSRAIGGGSGGSTSGSSDGIGSNALFSSPRGLFLLPNGLSMLIADTGNNKIRLVVISTLAVTTMAGGGGGGSSSGSADGTGTNALFNGPDAITASYDGSYALVGDTLNNVIRKIILTTGVVTTFAGTSSSSGSSNGIGTNALFYGPRGISISLQGEYALVADTSNNLIRSIVMSTGEVNVHSGGGGGTSSGSSDGIGTNALYSSPRSVAISLGKSVGVVVDNGNSLLRSVVLLDSSSPTLNPTFKPSIPPSFPPSLKPTCEPSLSPTREPTLPPTGKPTRAPTTPPSLKPTASPTTFPPSPSPTLKPTSTPRPTYKPSSVPTRRPSSEPSLKPTRAPTYPPTFRPTRAPTYPPTFRPTRAPTYPPTRGPTRTPTRSPTRPPTRPPTVKPSRVPSRPTSIPTNLP